MSVVSLYPCSADVVQADAALLDHALGGEVLASGLLPPASYRAAKVHARVLGGVCAGAAHVFGLHGVEFLDV